MDLSVFLKALSKNKDLFILIIIICCPRLMFLFVDCATLKNINLLGGNEN